MYRIGAAATVLAVLVVALPIRLSRAANEASAETCLRLADRPPAEGNDAEKTYQNVLTLDPDYADVRVRLATLLLGRGDAPEARYHAEQALRMQPNRTRVRQLLDEIARSTTP